MADEALRQDVQSDARAAEEVVGGLSPEEEGALDLAGKIADNLVAAEERLFRDERLADLRSNLRLRVGSAIIPPKKFDPPPALLVPGCEALFGGLLLFSI